MQDEIVHSKPGIVFTLGKGNQWTKGGSTIRLNAHFLTLDGLLSADGADVELQESHFPSSDVTSGAGAGSGGSIWITASGSLDGSGSLTARGGHCKIPIGNRLTNSRYYYGILQ